MDRSEAVRTLIFQVFDELNRSSPPSGQIVKSPETVLAGPNAALDSLGLVNFMVLLEQKVETALGVTITLMDEQALSETSSPFRTVRTLADHVAVLVDKARKGSGK